ATAEGLDLDRLAVERVHLRLVVEGIDVAGAAVHEQEDDALGFGGVVRLLRRHGADERLGLLARRAGGAEEAVGQHRRQGGGAEAGAGLPDELAAGAATELTAGGMHGGMP